MNLFCNISFTSEYTLC